MSGFFDDLDSGNVDSKNVKPLHSIETADTLDWCKKAVDALLEIKQPYTALQRANLAVYRGLRQNEKRAGTSEERYYKSNRIEKFVVNHLHDMTETKVSQLTRLKPAVEIIPTSDDYNDKNAAKAVKLLINHLWYINDIDKILSDLHRQALIFGESYLFIDWDKNKGDLHPAYVEAQQSKEELFIVDENNTPVKPIDFPVHIGDVCYEVELPWRVLLEEKEEFSKVNYCFRIKAENVEDLKKQYPSKSNSLKSDSHVKQFDVNSYTTKNLDCEAVVFYLYHKPNQYIKKGRYIKFTRDIILEDGEYPFSHGELPFVRLTDLDVPGELYGVSRYEQVAPIQNMHNNLSTLLAKNIYLTGHAKWVMPRGACKIEQLSNDNTVVQYQGPVPPVLANVAPNPPEAYLFRDKLRDEMGAVYGVHGVSRDAIPQGITAGVALQFLNEQESTRANSDIIKHNNMVAHIGRLSIAVAGDYYQVDDGRMLRILGNDNNYLLKFFDSAALHKSYDVRVQNSSHLPETKSGRTQRIIEIMQYKPDLIPDEQFIDLLDIGNTEKMTTLITEAVRTADSENEDILNGQEVAEPQEWEDHIIHWRIHSKYIQRRSFKEEVPPELREIFISHIATHEFAMIEKAKENPLFQAKLAQLDLFPIFYRDGFIPQSAQQQEAMVQGSANRGEPTDAQIPGEEMSPHIIDKGEKQ